MLNLVFGRAGSGKTYYARELLCRLAEQGKSNLMLLVPEQYSFESERAMLHRLGAQACRRVHVMSFTRLCDLLFREYGGVAGRRLDEGGRSLLMSLALEQCAEQLPLYRKHAQSAELIAMMLSASAEMKLCAVSPQKLESAAEQLPDSTLREKTKELAFLLESYDALVAQTYLDPMDDLTRLEALLKEHPFFNGYTVVVDSFKSFTMQELNVLEEILRQAEQVTVTLCAPAAEDSEQGMGVFSTVFRTARQLKRIARIHGIRVAEPVVLNPGMRFSSPELAQLESAVFQSGGEAYLKKPVDISLYRGNDRYEEASYVAMRIRRFVMEQGYRYRDFAVIFRSPEYYQGILDTVFDQWEIPFFMDRPSRVDAEPLMRLVLGALQIAKGNFRSDDVFAYLKTGLLPFTVEEIARIENYTFLWGITGARWKSEWKENPQGFAESITEKQVQELAEINRLREQITTPLIRFAKTVEDADGEVRAHAIFRLLEECRVPEQLQVLCTQLRKTGELELARRQMRIWEILMGILDQTAAVLKKTCLPLARYMELLHLVVLANDVADIPQGLDEVMVGAADRMRPAEPKIVFVLGASQGEFPLVPASNGLFTEEERRSLIELGIPLADTVERKALEERFLAYAAVASPSDKLIVTYAAQGTDGSQNLPSQLIGEIQSQFPMLAIQDSLMLPREDFLAAKSPAFEMMARTWKEESTFSATLKAVFQASAEYHSRIEALERAAEQKAFAFSQRVRSASLFGGHRHMSATQIETYHLCRFQYFCRYGLNAKERRPAEMDALEYGSLMHYLLEHVFREHRARELCAMESQGLQELVDGYILAYVRQRMGSEDSRTPRFYFLLHRLLESACVVILRVAQELEQSRFVPVGYEVELLPGTEYPPLVLTLENGSSVTVDGKIDRIDQMEQDGKYYVRVVDYKTGTKEFKLGDVLYGINIQMLIYLAAVIQGGEQIPAGVLYMPATRPLIPAQRADREEALEKEKDKRLCMKGIVLQNADVIRGMDADGLGKYIPVSLKDGEPAKSESVIAGEELEQVIAYIKKLIVEMAQTLQDGQVEANPLQGDYDACAYCPYFAVCGHEKDMGGRERSRLKKAETLHAMQKAQEGGGS